MAQDKNPIAPLITEISKLLHTIQNHKKPIKEINASDLQKLEQLEKAMQAFIEISAIASQDPEFLAEQSKAQLTKHSLSMKDKKLIDRAKAIEKDAKHLQLVLSKSISRSKTSPSEDDKEEIEKRKRIKSNQKKFKRLGGDGWIRP